MEEIAPGIFVETGYFPYNLALISTQGGALAIDLPPHPEHAQKWIQEAQSTVGKIKYVILTDASPERQIAAAHSTYPLIASSVTQSALMGHDERSWHELLESVSANYAEEADRLLLLKPRRATLTFNRRFRMHTTPIPVDFETPSGGTTGALWVMLPEQHLLFAGDTVVIDEPPPLEHSGDIKAWVEALGTLVKRTAVQQIVTGRGSTPVLRGTIEKQREFIRTMRHTAQDLFKKQGQNLNYAHAAQDLGQTFFNKAGNKAVKRIRRGLEYMVNELQKEKEKEREKLEATAQAMLDETADETQNVMPNEAPDVAQDDTP